MPVRCVRWLVVMVALVAVSVACSARGEPDATPGGGAVAALERAQASLADGFAMEVEVVNFVLPGWGGTDGGTVQVGAGGETARAQLRRTGEDSSYTVVLSGGATFFKRGTCESYARIPGGGAGVLTPFLLNASDAIATAANARFATPDHTVVEAEVAGLGDALITLDAGSGRVTSIAFGDQPNNRGSLGFTFTFTQWDAPLTQDAPPLDVPERAPGGSPC